MTRAARAYRTFFFEEPVFDDGARAPRLETYEALPGLTVCVPHVPASVDPAAAAELTEQLLETLVAERELRENILWFYTPMAVLYTRSVEAALVVYDCMDELSMFQGAPAELLELEVELLERADLVFTGGQALYESKRARHPAVHPFPSSVDAAHFAAARGPLEDPADQRGLSRPRLGFYGVIDERLDLALVETIAFARPDWRVIMVGPIAKIDPAVLPQSPNLHWLGPKRYDELPGYVAHWDVALMPFALNAATRFISPTKTLEYLAAGKPVVSTAIADVVRPYGDLGVVEIADRANIVAAIERALRSADTPQLRSKADAVVAQTSWDRTWRAMHDLMVARLASPEPAQPARERDAHV